MRKGYARLWNKMPVTLQRYLPRPLDRAQLRLTAMHAIQGFGPLAVRRAAPQVIAGLTGPVDESYDCSYFAMMGAGEWLLPESAPALAAFKAGLAGKKAQGAEPWNYFSVADSVWPRVPEVVPVLTAMLGDAFIAYNAAIALGRVGAPAASAIPALVQTVDLGAAGPFADAEAARFHMASTARRKFVSLEVRQVRILFFSPSIHFGCFAGGR